MEGLPIMRRFWKHLVGPLNSIAEQPYQFVVWWVVANVLGLAGFLLPIFLSWTRSGLTHDVYLALVRGGSLASFSVVLLAEGIASALVAQGAGSNPVAAGLRGLVSVVALMVVMVQVAFLVVQSEITNGLMPSPTSQIFVTLIAIACASYLYCFRFASWEKGVESVREEDDQAVQDLAKSAQGATTDDKGVKL